jgi:hypothetical protein
MQVEFLTNKEIEMKKILAMALCVGVGVLTAGIVRAEGDNGGKRHGKGGPRGGGQRPGVERFEKADANKDGKLSLEEFKTMNTKDDAEAKFKAADTDNDGFLTPAELKAAHQQKKAAAAAAAAADAPKADAPVQK